MVAKGSEWQYFVLQGEQYSPTDGWQLASFDHRQWHSGKAPLGYGEGDEATKIGFGVNKPISQYFVHRFTVEDLTEVDAPVLNWLADDGVVIYLNGKAVVTSMMPAVFDGKTLATGSLIESIWQQTPVAGDLLHQGENIIAAEVHQISHTSSDLRFDLAFTYTPFVQVAGKPQPLLKGVPVTVDVAVARSFSGDYVFELPKGVKQLTLKTAGGIGDGDLYLGFAQGPRLSAWQWRAANIGNQETIVVESPQAGRYVARIFAMRAVTGLNLQLQLP